DGVGDDDHAAHGAVPTCGDGRLATALCLLDDGSQRGIELQTAIGQERRATGHDGVALDDALDAQALRAANDVTGGRSPRRPRAASAMAVAIGCSEASSRAPTSRRRSSSPVPSAATRAVTAI